MYLYVARDELGRIVDGKLLKKPLPHEENMALFADSPHTNPITMVLVERLESGSSDEMDALEEILNNRSIEIRRGILLGFTACIKMGIELGTEQAPSMLC